MTDVFVFQGMLYYPAGGMDDYQGTFRPGVAFEYLLNGDWTTLAILDGDKLVPVAKSWREAGNGNYLVSLDLDLCPDAIVYNVEASPQCKIVPGDLV